MLWWHCFCIKGFPFLQYIDLILMLFSFLSLKFLHNIIIIFFVWNWTTKLHCISPLDTTHFHWHSQEIHRSYFYFSFRNPIDFLWVWRACHMLKTRMMSSFGMSYIFCRTKVFLMTPSSQISTFNSRPLTRYWWLTIWISCCIANETWIVNFLVRTKFQRSWKEISSLEIIFVLFGLSFVIVVSITACIWEWCRK